MKIFSKSIIFPFLVIFISALFYVLFVNTKPVAHSKKNITEFPVVEIEKLESDYFSSNINSFGEVISEKVIDIKFPTNGKIYEVGMVGDGSFIKKGDLIFSIDPFEIENNIEQNKAERKIISYNIEKLSKQIVSKKLYKNQITNQKNILSKQLENKLNIEGSSISKNSLDDLRISISRLEESLINTSELIDVLSFNLKTNEIQLNKINIIIERYENDLFNSKVIAPFSGYIENFKIYEGQEIFSNELLGVLKDTENLEVKFFIGGEDYNNLLKFKDRGIGSLVEIKWSVGKTVYSSEGVIKRIDGELNNNTAGIYLYAKLTENVNSIPIGAFVEINMQRKINYKSIKIPYSAVFNNKYIYIMNGNTLKKTKIKIIGEEKNGLLIKDEELAGKSLVITRLSDMQDNMQVKPILSANK